MPLYEYRCESCGHQFEKIQRFSDDPITVCPSCGSGPVVKLLSSPAIQFKGSGWYITDYARKGGEGAKSGDTPKSGTSKTEKTETPASSTTPATGTSSSSNDTSSSTKKD